MSEITLADLMNSRDTAAPVPSPLSAEELSREITLLSHAAYITQVTQVPSYDVMKIIIESLQ